MNVRANFDAMSGFKKLNAKSDFIATVVVALRIWDELDEASWWCERLWQTSRRPYRRTTNSDDQSAIFEFPDAEEAADFFIRFGSTAREC